MQQELIAEIPTTALWPVVVTVDGNICIPEESDFIDRDGSYIILIPDGNLKIFQVEFNELAEGRSNKFIRFWKTEPRFVVFRANGFPLLQHMYIFNCFSKFRIYNGIIVSQEHYVIDKGYSRPINDNNVYTGLQLGVYTWFRYQSTHHCIEVNGITVLDT